MPLKDDLEKIVKEIFYSPWTKRDGEIVPEPTGLKLGNDAVKLQATVLYADMADSTQLVDNHTADFAAEVYKAYMACAARIIKAESGSITAYDGDRVMAVFIGNLKNTPAARAALKLRYAVTNVINPAIKVQYSNSTYQLQHSVGIDTSSILASRIGVRIDNDIVWVGRAANYGAKLSNLPAGFTYITKAVFDKLNDAVKYGGDPRTSIWEQRSWIPMDNMTIYRSHWHLPF